MTARSLTMVTLHDTWFVECQWWNDGWTVKTRHLTVVGLHDTGPRMTDRSSIFSRSVHFVVKEMTLKETQESSLCSQ